MIRLITKNDAGGWRQYLADRPVHCGASLELAERVWKSKLDDYGELHEWTEYTGKWLLVRYEIDWTREGKRVPTMYASIAGHTFTAKITDEHKFRWPERDS